jgi:hypothetical protein
MMSEIRYTPSDEATLIDGYFVFWRKMKPLGVGLYLAGINNVPVVAPSLFWVSGLVYHWVPSLNDHSSPQVAVLVAALTAGGLLWIFLLPPRTCLCKSLGCRPVRQP